MKKTIPIIILFLCSSLSAFSQTTLSLKEAIHFALEHKAEAVKAGLAVENSAYLIEEARSNALPQISVQGGVTYNALLQQMALTMGGETTVIEMGRPWQSTATVQLNQQIFNMAVFQGLKAAKTTREFYRINKDLTEEQVIEKVAKSYFQVFKIQSQITTIEKTIENTTRVRDVLAGLFKNGLAKKIDLDRMNVSLNNLSSERQHFINALALQKNSLKFLIGMAINTKIQLPDNTFKVDPHLTLNNPESLDQLTEIQLLQKQNELLHYNKKAIEAKRYPVLSLTANYGYSGLGERLPYFKGADQGVNWSDYASVGLNLSIPLFTGFNNRAKIQQARIKIEENKADLQDTRLALSLAQKNAEIQIKNSLITLRSQQANKKLAKDVMESVENNYKNGLATLTDLLDAENSYVEAQNSYTNALMDYKLAEIQLIKSQGQLTTYYTK